MFESLFDHVHAERYSLRLGSVQLTGDLESGIGTI